MKIKRFKGDVVLYFVCTALLVVLGVILIPGVTELGQDILNYVIAAGILCYLFAYLLGKIKHSRQVIMVLTIVEFILMFLIALGLVLAQFKVIEISGACKIIGLALALRGAVEMFRAYFYQSSNNVKYPLWQFVLNLIILILGVYMFAAPFISDDTMITVMAVVCFVGALICLALAITGLDKKKKKA